MSRIPFIEARFFEQSHTVLSVQKRLTAYLQDLRAGKKSPAPKITNFDLINGTSDGKILPPRHDAYHRARRAHRWTAKDPQ